MAVNRTDLQRAFAVAHRASEDDGIPKVHRDKFKEIARLLWKAHGEPKLPPAGVGRLLIERMELKKFPNA